MDRELVDYCEKDLGIDINGSLHFNFQSDMLYSKANQRLGFLKRTCHFVKNSEFKMALFWTLFICLEAFLQLFGQ